MPRRRPADVPVLPWAEWWPQFAAEYRVEPGSADHVTIIGPTGTGKTTLAMQIATLRKYVVVLGCKPEDDQLARLAGRGGYWRTASGELPSPAMHPRVLVWPPYDGIADEPNQGRQFATVLDQAFSAGGWHVVAEEAPHLVDLGLARRLRTHLRMGRSMASGLILCAQRPRGLPYEAISGAQHLIIFGSNDVEDLKRLGGMNGADPWSVRDTVARLGRRYHFLHVNTRTGMLRVSRMPAHL